MAINVPRVNPRLANIQAPNLHRINVGGAIESGVNLGQKLQGIRERDDLQGLLQDQGQAALGGDQEALNQIALQGTEGAELAGSLQQIVASRDEQKLGIAQRQIKKQGTFLASLINAKPEVQRRKIFEQANKLLSEGDRERGAEFLRISQLKDPLEIQGEIESALVLSQGGDKFLQRFIPQAGSAGATKLIGSPQRIVKDGKAFLSGVVQKPDGSFVLEELEVGGEFADVQGVTASQKADQAADIARSTAQAKADVGKRSARELETEKKKGATSIEIESGIVKAAQQARRTRPKVARVREALNFIETGKLAEAKSILGPFIPLLNIEDEQVMQSEITAFVLDTLNEQSGTKTDFDFKKAAEASASLGKSTEANKRILDILIQNLDRASEEEDQFVNFVDIEKGDALRFRFEPKASELTDEELRAKIAQAEAAQ